MVERYKPLPPRPGSDLPPPYSRAPPPPSPSLLYPRVQPTASRRFLPGDDDDPPPFPASSDSVFKLPQYTAFDETISSFQLMIPLIYTRNSDGKKQPRYQLFQELTKSGKPWRLKIRRLLPTESRRLSLPNTSSSKAEVVDYDDDTTLYIIENQGALNPFKGQSVEIRGRRAKTLPGLIKLHEGAGAAANCEFWHMTRNAANDSLRKENEKKMLKYGYHADDEWKKKKLFSSNLLLGGCGKIDWKNDEGKVVATEYGNDFEVMDGVDQRTRDALVTCFVARRWASGSLNWSRVKTRANDESLELVRAVTTNN
jgi:hypothetical protein